MKTIYRTNFEKIRSEYPAVFDALDKVSRELNVAFYLIGAQARNIWMNHLNLEMRTTNDVDYCVYVNDREIWNRINEYLVDSEGFARDKKLPYRFRKKGQMMDIIPFGGLEQNGEVILDNPTMELSVIGCREVTEEAVTIDGSIKAITLPGTCILKLVAYSENPNRIKDFLDYLFFAANYHEVEGEELFSGRHDDLLKGNFEMNIACARILGRHMSPIMKKSNRLHEIITGVLIKKMNGYSDDEISQLYEARDSDDKLVLQMKLIAETIKGIND